jgi:formate--tetrahydrofolate ligase
MEPRTLKQRYGDRLVFYGGGVNTQQTLPFGTPAEVRAEVLERCEVFAKGGEGGIALAHEVLALLEEGGAKFAPIYEVTRPIREKIETVARRVYGAEGVDYSPKADRSIDYLQSIGMGETPVCMAKTQYSLTDDATRLGRPTGFRITVNEVYPAAGAGFVVAQCGDIMTMPGLPKEPAAERMAIGSDGAIVGLS